MTTEPVQRKLQFVFEKYGIRPAKNFTFSFFSMGNEVFFIRDTKNRRLVLKNCLKNRSAQMLASEIALVEHLNKNGCGAPVIVPGVKGEKFVEMDGDFFIMTKFMRGHMPSWNTHLKTWHYRESIKGLACYHRAASTLDPTIDTDRIKTCEYERTLEWTENLARILKEDTSGRPSVAKMRTIIDAYVDIAKKLPETLPAAEAAKCETLMIHGDFHAFNVVYRFRRFHACYDFDFIRRDLKLFDILWTFGFAQRKFYYNKYGKKIWNDDFRPEADDARKIEIDSLRWFVRIYRKTWKLSKAEILLIPGMQNAMALYNLRFFDLAHSEEECMEHFGWYAWILKKREYMDGPCREAALIVAAEADE